MVYWREIASLEEDFGLSIGRSRERPTRLHPMTWTSTATRVHSLEVDAVTLTRCNSFTKCQIDEEAEQDRRRYSALLAQSMADHIHTRTPSSFLSLAFSPPDTDFEGDSHTMPPALLITRSY